MATLLDALSQENLDNQREVVKNEKRWSYDNQPYGSWSRSSRRTSSRRSHPYHHPTIGSMEDLDAASLEDVRAFFRTYYAPNNAVLSIVGDVDPAQARALGGAVLRADRRRRRRCPALRRSLAAALARRRGARGRADRVPLPRVFVGSGRRSSATRASRRSRSPARSSPAARGAGSTGASSARSGSPRTCTFFVMAFVGGASIAAGWATVRPGVDVDRVEAAYLEELERIAREPVTDDELARAKALVETERARRAPAGRGARRPALDVRDAVRRSGPDQPRARRATSRSPRRTIRGRRGRGVPRRQPRRHHVPAGGGSRGRRRRRRGDHGRGRGGDGMSGDRPRDPAGHAGRPAPVRVPGVRARRASRNGVEVRDGPPAGPSARERCRRRPARRRGRAAGACRRLRAGGPGALGGDRALRRDRARRGRRSGSAPSSTPRPAGTRRPRAWTCPATRLGPALELLAEMMLRPDVPRRRGRAPPRPAAERDPPGVRRSAPPRGGSSSPRRSTPRRRPYRRPHRRVARDRDRPRPRRAPGAARATGSTRPARRSSWAATSRASTSSGSSSRCSAPGARRRRPRGRRVVAEPAVDRRVVRLYHRPGLRPDGDPRSATSGCRGGSPTSTRSAS